MRTDYVLEFVLNFEIQPVGLNLTVLVTFSARRRATRSYFIYIY